MTPDQLEIIDAFKGVNFRPQHREFVNALIATAKQSPGTELNDKQAGAISDLAFKYRRQMPVGLVIKQDKQAIPTLKWMAQDMVKSGNLRDEPWVADNARRAVALFPNKSLHTCAALLGALHPFAFDYIQQSPVLILAVSQGSALTKVAERKKVAREWSARFEGGGKLRDIMKLIDLPYPLRRLHPSILESSHWSTVQALSDLDRQENVRRRGGVSVLADMIPEREDQKEWLNAIGQWIGQMQRRFNDRIRFLEWACRQFAPANMRRLQLDVRDVLNNISTIADYAGAPNTEFNPALTVGAALVVTREWHDRMARQDNEQRFFAQHAYGWEQPVDYTPFPVHVTLDGFDFRAMRTGRDLFEEGREMHHCVGSYSRDVISGVSRIYSMTDAKTGKRHATVEFSQGKYQSDSYNATGTIWTIGAESLPADHGLRKAEPKQYKPAWFAVQAKGPCNAQLTPEATAACKAFGSRLNYYWAMFKHEQESRADYERRLELLMLNPTAGPVLMLPTEFPEMLDDAKRAKIDAVQAAHIAKLAEKERVRKIADRAEQRAKDKTKETAA